MAGTCESAALREVKEWHPVLLALLGTSFGWFMTALGAAAGHSAAPHTYI